MQQTVAATDVHVHSIPILLGAKYYLMPDRQGLFGAVELGLFDLMTSAGNTSQNDLKFGTGVGVGYAMKQWNARVNLHSQDVGHFGDLLMITAGVGYQFAGSSFTTRGFTVRGTRDGAPRTHFQAHPGRGLAPFAADSCWILTGAPSGTSGRG